MIAFFLAIDRTEAAPPNVRFGVALHPDIFHRFAVAAAFLPPPLIADCSRPEKRGKRLLRLQKERRAAEREITELSTKVSDQLHKVDTCDFCVNTLIRPPPLLVWKKSLEARMDRAGIT